MKPQGSEQKGTWGVKIQTKPLTTTKTQLPNGSPKLQSKSSSSISDPNGFPDPNAQYAIVTALDNLKCLDISMQNSQKKHSTVLWELWGSKNQKFKFKPLQNGNFQIWSSLGYILQIPKGSTEKCVQPVAAPLQNFTHEEWKLIPADGYKNGFIIQTFCGKVLDVSKQSTKNGAQVIQYDMKKKPSNNQVWYLRKM